LYELWSIRLFLAILSVAGVKGSKNPASGHSKAGYTNKIQLPIDSHGNPVRIALTGDEVHDFQRSKLLIE
jgi:hypothetical protein